MEQINRTQSAATANEDQEREADSADKVFRDIVAAADLPGGQKKALISLMLGNSPERAARAGGVHRGTLYRWMKDDPAFGAVLAECRAARFADANEQLNSLIGECVNLVYTSIIAGDKLMAFRLLRMMGIVERRRDGKGMAFMPGERCAGQQARGGQGGATDLHLSREGKSPQEIVGT